MFDVTAKVKNRKIFRTRCEQVQAAPLSDTTVVRTLLTCYMPEAVLQCSCCFLLRKPGETAGRFGEAPVQVRGGSVHAFRTGSVHTLCEQQRRTPRQFTYQRPAPVCKQPSELSCGISLRLT